MASSFPSNANSTARSGQASGYDIALNNCLTKAVAILRSYGVTGLPGAAAVSPNLYYSNSLPGGFEPATSLLTVGVLLVDPLTGSYINTNPVNKQRPLTVRFYNGSNTFVGESQINASNVSGTDRYVATVSIPGQFRSGDPFLVTMRLDYTLFKRLDGFGVMGQSFILADDKLTVGDVNQDNTVNTTDYNLMMQCYSDITPPKGPCDSQLKRASDLNDDGFVNQYDSNLYLRVVQNVSGG